MVKCAWASIDENGKARGGKIGNQTGRETREGSWYRFKQKEVYRWKDRKLAEKYASLLHYIVTKCNVGYNQNNRTSLFNALKELKWESKALTKPVDTDCSDLVISVVNLTLGKELVPSWGYTGNLGALLMQTGYFKKLTGSKYTDSDNYLKVGDIINAPNHHVISALENGEITNESMFKKSSKVPEPTLKRGCTGSEVKKLQVSLNKLGCTDGNGKTLETDGIFGASTGEALKRFQRRMFANKKEWDGVYGKKSKTAMEKALKKV